MTKPVIAILYDFDKTLCTEDMQNYSFIPNLGLTPAEFWGKTGILGNNHSMDKILAYMYEMLHMCKEKDIKLTKEYLNSLGKNIKYFPGVTTWFNRINSYAEKLGVKVEHYIVSSGIKEIIEGTEISKFFKKIYACEFMYDYTGSIKWPKFAVNYTAKTQFLFRINKGILTIDSKSADKLNRFTPEQERRVPFCNMIYIGDGLTDVPCMKLVKSNGGQSIAVYDQEKGKDAAEALKKAGRVNFITVADYSSGSDIEMIVQSILKKIQAVEEMQTYQ